MHVFLEVALTREGRQHEHVVRHRVGQLVGPPGDVPGPTHLEPIQQTLRVGAKGHDVEVLSWNRGGL